MLASFKKSIAKLVRPGPIRKKILITALILIVFRLAAHVPAAGVNREALGKLFSGSAILSLLDLFSGGTLANFSILALGLNPYINASIILQLLTFISPQLEELQEEGEYGQEKINQYTRFLTVPLAAMQSFGAYMFLKRAGIIGNLSPLALLALVLTMTTGTLFSVWLGELIHEYGVGNGVSFLIFAGIVSKLPLTFINNKGLFAGANAPKILVVAVISLVIISLVVLINDATRQIRISYARRARRTAALTDSNYLPLKLNQAGVIPIIFAVSLVLMPSLIAQFASGINNEQIRAITGKLAQFSNPQSVSYNVVYFLLVVGFTYFYTSVVFKPEKVAERLQKNGGFIPGVRPGSQTVNYLNFVMSRVTFAGAIFLGFIAIFPSIVQQLVQIPNLLVGGTGVLIVVSVVLEMTRSLQSQMVTRRYEGFIRE